MAIAPTPPINTYGSLADLNLTAVPVGIEDEAVYSELLDIHNAIEILLTHSDSVAAEFAAFIAKRRNNTVVTSAESPYTITAEDGTIIIDASLGSITVILPDAVSFPGYSNSIKCIDDTYGAFVTTDGIQTLEGELDPFELFESEYIDVKSDDANWLVVGD